MSKTVLFQIIQFSISTQFISIGPINRILSFATNLGQSESGSNTMKRYSASPKPPALLEPHPQIV